MRKVKFILSANSNGAENYARENKLKRDEWVYLHNVYRQLCGIEPKSVEFVYVDGWFMNGAYEEKTAELIMQEFVILGAKKTYL